MNTTPSRKDETGKVRKLYSSPKIHFYGAIHQITALISSGTGNKDTVTPSDMTKTQ